MTKNFVIAVSAIAGGGKTTVVQKLVELLDDAVAIYFDDYTTPETYPEDPAAILEKGADFNVIKSPLLAQHLHALRMGETIISPKSGEAVSPAKYIVFEGPLGRAQQETGQYIDFLAFIDTPLEVGLARMVSRTIEIPEDEKMSRDELIGQITDVKGLADGYLQWMRRGYLAQFEQIKPASDLIVDWELSVEDMAKAILDALTRK